MTAITFRDAAPEDIPAILRLLADDHLGKRRDDPAAAADPAYRAAFDAIAADPNHRLIVAELEGAVIGTMQLIFRPGLAHRGAWTGVVESVRIDSALRGLGHGEALMGWAMERCRERGCTSMSLKSDVSRVSAHRFYLKLGFVHTHLGLTRPL